MTAPNEDYIALPSETGNTGDKIRAVIRHPPVIPYDPIVHHYIPVSSQLIKSVNYITTALYAVANTAQDAVTTAIFWLQNPTASTTNLRVRKIDVCMTNNVATAITHATAPRIAFSRATFTGTFSGASISSCQRKTSDTSANGVAKTAITGATVTLVGPCWIATVPGNDASTAAGVYNLMEWQKWKPFNEDEFIDLAPGECLVAYQIDAGTTSDQRVLTINVCWDEYDNQ